MTTLYTNVFEKRLNLLSNFFQSVKEVVKITHRTAVLFGDNYLRYFESNQPKNIGS